MSANVQKIDNQFITKQNFMKKLEDKMQGKKTVMVGVIMDSREEVREYQGAFKQIENQILEFAGKINNDELKSSEMKFFGQKLEDAFEYMHGNMTKFFFTAENAMHYSKDEIFPVLVIILGLSKNDQKTYGVIKFHIQNISKQHNGYVIYIAQNENSVELAEELEVDDVMLLKDWN